VTLRAVHQLSADLSRARGVAVVAAVLAAAELVARAGQAAVGLVALTTLVGGGEVDDVLRSAADAYATVAALLGEDGLRIRGGGAALVIVAGILRGCRSNLN